MELFIFDTFNIDHKKVPFQNFSTIFTHLHKTSNKTTMKNSIELKQLHGTHAKTKL